MTHPPTLGIVRAPSWRAYGAADKSAARSYRAADESAARRSVIPSPLLFIDLIQYLYIYAAPSTCSTASGYLGGELTLSGWRPKDSFATPTISEEVFFVAPGLPSGQVAVDSLPPAEANDRCARACRC